MGNLEEAFVSAWGGPAKDLPDALEALLARTCTTAADAWPELQIEPAVFVRFLAARLPGDVPLPAALDQVHAKDLYLTCGCSLGMPPAIEAFERRCLGGIGGFLQQIDGGAGLGDEVKQLVRSRLLVAEGGQPPRISQYEGRGSLTSWVGIAAQRVVLSLRRGDRSRGRAQNAAMADAMTEGGDPELDYLKVRHRQDFRAAFADAIGTLSARERVILKLHLVDGLSHEEIGAMYQVHQSTVTRWIARARESLVKETHRLVCERLQVDTAEFESLAVLVESQLDLSLSRLLRTEGGGGE
jgi:RNA polymerase sigma-70 factor (ECF subfamily)